MKQSLILPALVAAVVAATSSNNTNSTEGSEGLISNGKVHLGEWTSAYNKAKDFVSKLSFDEKVSVITAGSLTNASVSWTALAEVDGAPGAQEYYYESAFGQTNALAMTWDKNATYAQGKAVGTEFYQKGIQIINAPDSMPMGRTPWGGRNGEGFGPDAYFNGIMSGVNAKAYNDAGVIGGAKHFLLYEQETNRNNLAGGQSSSSGSTGGSGPSGGSMSMGSSPSMSTGSVQARSDNGSTSSSSSSSSDVAPYSSNADDKTIHETYLWPWYDMVKNNVGAAMCAMTEVNGTAACDSKDLLMGLLKTELGFPGMVVPDTTAQKTAEGSATGGLDLGSSSTWTTSVMKTMLENGTISDERLDDMVMRNVIGYYFAGMDNGEMPSEASYDDYVDTMGNHSTLIRENGAKAIVLLKNTGGLPLNKPHRMSVFGAHAGPVMGGPNMQFSIQGSGPTYDGHLASGSGSAQASFPYLVTPESALTYRAIPDHTNIKWILNDTYSATSSGNTLVSIGSSQTGVDPSYAGYASTSDACLVFINALSGEGADRTELYNDDQDTMVNTVAENCNNTIVIVTTTGVRLLDQWIENENITAVLYSAPLGQESGNSIADVLYGDVNPSGRLIYTIAKNESDYNVGLCDVHVCNFTEGNYIDYKSFEYRNVTPRYAFGHGLSYTTFNYSDVEVTKLASNLSYHAEGRLEVGGRADLWDIVAKVEIDVQNTGSRDGAEVPQLYISYPEGSGAQQPKKALRGFERVEIASGSSEHVVFELRRRDLSFWDVTAQEWALPTGTFTLHIGASSTDIRLTDTLTF